ncbi:MAG: hypothetical protein H6698_00735 [Myxococcales bacterium]|nr:hypothetical protein [Myxococcales bacterium]MCB9531950.1 hypothetical protein [Myxococcales bacterium]MCB9532837.1 hypothetical protein [Myxococcales bacterium]
MTQPSPPDSRVPFLKDPVLWDLALTLLIFAPLRFALFPPKVFFKSPLILPEADYYGASIFLAALLHSPGLQLAVGMTTLVGVLHFVRHSRNPFAGRVKWSDDDPNGLRLMLMAMAFPLMWKLSTPDFSVWFGSSHLFDRALLVAMWGAIAATPLALPVFSAFAGVMAAQYFFPSCFEPTWADKALLLYSVLLGWAVFLASRIRKTHAFVYPLLLICMFGGFYFYPAVAKLRLGGDPTLWLRREHVHLLFISAHLNGWLPNLVGDTFSQVVDFVRSSERFIVIYTITLEIAVIGIALARRGTIAMFLLVIAMHTGIFLSSGIFFWEWVVPELALLGLLLTRWSTGPVAELYRWRNRWVSALLVVFALPWTWPYLLGWMDTPYTVTYDIEAENARGEHFQIRREYLDPYELALTQNRLWFLDPAKEAPIATYSATANIELFEALSAATSAAEVQAVRDRLGEVRYDAEEAEAFGEWLQRFFAYVNEHDGDKNVVPRWLEAPHHQMALAGTDLTPSDLPITRARVFARSSWWNGERIEVIDERIILDVEIPSTYSAVHTAAE